MNYEDSLYIIKNGPNDQFAVNKLEKDLENLRSKNSITFSEFANILIYEKEAKGLSSQHLKEAVNQLTKFLSGKSLLINDINYELLNQFILYKKLSGTGEHGISYYLRSMRTIYLEAQRRESYGIKSGNPFKGLIKKGKKKEIPNISPEDLRRIFNYESNSSSLANKRSMKRTARIWLFQFAIGGQDYIDIAHLTWDNISNDRIRFQRYKNKNKPGGGPIIDNRLNRYALDIIKKYGDRSSRRIFSFIPIDKRYKHHRQNINRSLKTISAALEFQSELKTKSPRYLFRTYAGNLLINTLVIMQIQGHTPQGITFGYQRRLPNSIIDKELAKINKQIFI
ncbi:phage integrase SAM-like domain-containing protein [Robertkochia aurantiaca]|uniref:phage integrase SAM-like domain-containing protein n=1 Tax=Robertkochia aurantiaca TaxID=2873700 RepID=UPI001CCBD869|nr:phage integrase SAM-like domain-containing protein [Robertkochia sp. 3YJGBD-33]